MMMKSLPPGHGFFDKQRLFTTQKYCKQTGESTIFRALNPSLDNLQENPELLAISEFPMVCATEIPAWCSKYEKTLTIQEGI